MTHASRKSGPGLYSGIVIVALIMATGCGESSTAPRTSSNDANDFALAAMMGGLGATGIDLTNGRVEQPCPEGGSRVIDGAVTGAAQGDEHSVTWDFTVQHRDCTIRISHVTVGEVVLVLSGASHSEGHMRVRITPQSTQPPVLLEMEGRNRGEMTTREGTHVRTCAFDLTQRFDPATNQVRLTGTSCGHTIDMVRPAVP